MIRENYLSVLDIVKELNTGKATIKFMLKRFKKWLPYELIDGQVFYNPEKTLKLLFVINENLDMGVVPSKIEKKLEALNNDNSDDLLNHFLNSSKNENILLTNDRFNLFESLVSNIGEQQKRIAKAHEKRAQVEERKAFAIEKRAKAEEKKAEAMNNIANALQEMNKLRVADPAARQIAHQTASMIVTDETKIQQGPEDSLSKLDDLSELIDEDPLVSAESIQLDDLSLLIDQDDDKPAMEPSIEIELDDLSKLIDIDDSQDSGQKADDMDDLSLLITDDSPEIKIDISPDEDIEEYKAAVMKAIIGLKDDGLDVDVATKTLNENKVKTLSGKPEWGKKAISQIYKFIDSAK